MTWLLVVIAGAVAFAHIAFLTLLMVTRGASGETARRARVEIEGRAEEVYEWLTRPEKLERWASTLSASTPASREGAVGQGASYSKKLGDEEGGGIEGRVEKAEPESRLELSFRSPGLEGRATWEIEQVNGHVRLDFSEHARYHGFMDRLMLPLAAPVKKRKMRRDLERLKELVEREN